MVLLKETLAENAILHHFPFTIKIKPTAKIKFPIHVLSHTQQMSNKYIFNRTQRYQNKQY